MTAQHLGGAVLLTRSSREHIYVANRLVDGGHLSAILVEAPQSPRGLRGELRRLRRRYGWSGMAERVGLRIWRSITRQGRRREERLAQVLGSSSAMFARPELVREVEDLNGDETHALLSGLEPDLLLVYGTGIIRDPILATARIGALNMHTGISPHYRGSDCAFWPVHDGRFDLLGATVHECTSAIDGGAILSTDRADLEPTDDLEAIFARCVATGAHQYRDCVEQVLRTGRIEGRQQVDEGREFRAAMRGFRAEVRARRRLYAGELSRFVRDAEVST